MRIHKYSHLLALRSPSDQHPQQQHPHKPSMDRLKSLISGCIQARKRSKHSRQHHHPHWPESSSTWDQHPLSSCPHNPAAATQRCLELDQLDDKPTTQLQKRSSIRIVPVSDSDSDLLPDKRLSLTRFSDEITAVEDDSDRGSPGPSTEEDPSLIPRRPLPDIKPRRIEDIPEEDESEVDNTAQETEHTQDSKQQGQQEGSQDGVGGGGGGGGVQKPIPSWRVSRRKSLVEILHLLQSTASSAPKLSSIKLPLPPRSSLRKRPSSASTSLPSLASSLSTAPTSEDPEPESDEEVKKQRRMAGIIFPAGMRLGGAGHGRHSMKNLGREEQEEDSVNTEVEKGGIQTTTTALSASSGKDKTLFY